MVQLRQFIPEEGKTDAVNAVCISDNNNFVLSGGDDMASKNTIPPALLDVPGCPPPPPQTPLEVGSKLPPPPCTC